MTVEERKEYNKKNYLKNKEKQKQWYLNNKEIIKKYSKLHHEKNKDVKKNYREKNKDKIEKYIKQYAKKYIEKNKNAIKDYAKKYYENNKEKNKEKLKQYYQENKKKRNLYVNNKRQTNTLFKLSSTLRVRIIIALRAKSWNKRNTTKDILGCDFKTVKLHLENQFVDGMSWDNHGLFGWHIDHIIPLASAKTEKELYKLCHYTNLQPLWAEDNLKKSDKINY